MHLRSACFPLLTLTSGEHGVCGSDGDVCRHGAGKPSKMDFTTMNSPGVTVKALAGKACQILAVIF